MDANRFTFGKEEKLCSRKIIQDLFARKGSFSSLHYPILGIWQFRELPEPVPQQVVFSIGTKNFKRAHDRNLIRRRLREAYRLEKTFLVQVLLNSKVQCALVVIYVAKEPLPYIQIRDAIRKLFESIAKGAEQSALPVADSLDKAV